MLSGLIFTFDHQPNFGHFGFFLNEGFGGSTTISWDDSEESAQANNDSFGFGSGSLQFDFENDGTTQTVIVNFLSDVLKNSEPEDFTYRSGDFESGTDNDMRLIESPVISNQVAGTAGTPHSFRLNKLSESVNTGKYRLRRSFSTFGSGVLNWDADLATIQASVLAQGQNYTITDEGSYFQFTRNVNGSNSTWLAEVDASDPAGRLTQIEMQVVEAPPPEPSESGLGEAIQRYLLKM